MELKQFTGIEIMPTKQSIAAQVAKLNDVYAEGGLDVKPEKDYILLKALELFVKDALEVCRPWALNQLQHYSDAERKNLYGAQVSIVSGKAKYDFESCTDVADLEQLVAESKAVVKGYEAELKKAKETAIREQRATFAGEDQPTISVKFLA